MYRRLVGIWTILVLFFLRERRAYYIKRMIKGLDSIGVERDAWLSVLKECAPYAKHVREIPYPYASYAAIFAAPFVFLQKTTNGKAHVALCTEEFWEGKKLYVYYGAKDRARSVMGGVKAGRNTESWYTLDADSIVPVKAQIEFLKGLLSEFDSHLEKQHCKKRLAGAEKSKALTALYPTLKEKRWPSQHVWVTCPSCAGTAVVVRSEGPLVSCPYCAGDIVIVAEESCVGEGFSLVEVESPEEPVSLSTSEWKDKKWEIKSRMRVRDVLAMPYLSDEEVLSLYTLYEPRSRGKLLTSKYSDEEKIELRKAMTDSARAKLELLSTIGKEILYDAQSDKEEEELELKIEYRQSVIP